MFGEFGEFDLVGGDFGGGMEDIEVARDAKTDMLDMETTDQTGLQVCVCVCVRAYVSVPVHARMRVCIRVPVCVWGWCVCVCVGGWVGGWVWLTLRLHGVVLLLNH